MHTDVGVLFDNEGLYYIRRRNLDVDRTHRPELSARAGHLLIYGISVLQRCAERGCYRVVDVPGLAVAHQLSEQRRLPFGAVGG